MNTPETHTVRLYLNIDPDKNETYRRGDLLLHVATLHRTGVVNDLLSQVGGAYFYDRAFLPNLADRKLALHYGQERVMRGDVVAIDDTAWYATMRGFSIIGRLADIPNRFAREPENALSAFVVMLSRLGLTREEIGELRFDDIDWTTGQVRRKRKVPVSEAVADLVRDLKVDAAHDVHVFPKREGK